MTTTTHVTTPDVQAVTSGLKRDQQAADKALAKLAELDRGDARVQIGGEELKLSNLHKVMYPELGFTKLDVIRYLVAISPVLLPHLRDRALTLKRYPNGVEGQMFYQKRAPEHAPGWIHTSDPLGDQKVNYILADDLRTLVYVANLADLEQHVLLSKADGFDRPTAMAFDLDPGEGVDAIGCCRVAVLIRDLLADLGLDSYAKTSGSKGVQLYVPLNTPDATYEGPSGTKAFARVIAELLEKQHPDLVVHKQLKTLRRGKVLVDWSQNDESKTTVCVYSLRAKVLPTASTPITWEEVDAALESGDAEDLRFTWDETLARACEHGDLFEPVLKQRQSVPELG